MPILENHRYEAFCREYLVDMVASRAAIRSGFSPKNAASIGCLLLQKPEIQERIAELKAEQLKRISISADEVLREWWRIATADPNEVSQNRVGCCRYCHGADHMYQWRTEREFTEAVRLAKLKYKLEDHVTHREDPRVPCEDGGYGYNVKLNPHRDCPECNGLGQSYPVFPDSTKLSEKGKSLYRGTKVTRNGIEVMMADKDKALDSIARHLGMFAADNKSDIGEETKAFLASIMGSKAPIARD